MRIALDTNILAYAEGIGDQVRRDASLELLSHLSQDLIIVPAQTLGELYRVLTGKGSRGHSAAREAILSWGDSFDVADSTWGALQAAMDLSTDHGLQIWDALILSVAAEHGCRLLLSEDLHDGFTWRGVTVTNPYSPRPHPLLSAAIQSSGER